METRKKKEQIQTTIYKIDKQQGPTVQHRELYEKIICIYTCITESLHCTPETNTTL